MVTVTISFLLEEVELLIGHQDRQFDGALRGIKVFGLAGAAGRFPFVVLAPGERYFAQLCLSEPVRVPLICPFPERLLVFLFLRRRLQRSSSAPASSCASTSASSSSSRQ